MPYPPAPKPDGLAERLRRNKEPIPNYVCHGRGRNFGDPACQSILGIELDRAVGKVVVESVTPMALELALAVQQELQLRLDQADRLRYRQIERAQYEADQARHRYMQVDAANRLVADSLEAYWNEKLRTLQEARQQYEQQRNADRLLVDEEERRRILALATDFPTVWSDPQTPQRERKRMLALVIEDVTLTKQRQITAAVRFRGGETLLLTLPRPLTAQQLRATHEDVRREIDVLLDEHSDAQVAEILNRRGRRTGAGDAFDVGAVRWVRFSARFKNLQQRLLASGWSTGTQARAKLQVGRSTLTRWRRQGRLEARICNDSGEWLYRLPTFPADASSPPTEFPSLRKWRRPAARGAV